ncbi:MAG TPA: NAD(P)-dependent oxidoreductase, partial [Verrucomicrobiae bacterium]|nr:NAD(P)-dependent oxidoreductase [Verrucomicrobiae bacterium]
ADGGKLWDQLLGGSASKLRFVKGDILDAAKLGDVFDQHAISHVIHLAGVLTPVCQKNPYRGCEINVLGTVRVFDAVRARLQSVRGFSYASSFAAHGPGPGAGIPEYAQSDPPTFYGAFKKAVELIARQYGKHYGVPSIGIRPFVVYGPGRESGLTAAPSLAAKAVAENKPFKIGFSGGIGLEFVEDVARAFVRGALNTPDGSLVVDMPGQQVPVNAIIDTLERISPGAAGLLSSGGPLVPVSVASSPLLMIQVFPDWHATSLEEGLRRTVDFYRQQLV